MLDPMTDKPMTLEQKVCHLEGGAKQVSIAQVCEVLRVLADLFVNDESARAQFIESYEGPARKRMVRRIVDEAVNKALGVDQPSAPDGVEGDPLD
jgi:hypothetical protein